MACPRRAFDETGLFVQKDAIISLCILCWWRKTARHFSFWRKTSFLLFLSRIVFGIQTWCLRWNEFFSDDWDPFGLSSYLFWWLKKRSHQTGTFLIWTLILPFLMIEIMQEKANSCLSALMNALLGFIKIWLLGFTMKKNELLPPYFICFCLSNSGDSERSKWVKKLRFCEGWWRWIWRLVKVTKSRRQMKKCLYLVK